MASAQAQPSQQRHLDEGVILVSKTDLKSHILEANRPFVRISGYSEQELLGSPHNMVRHADMPKEAFADLWRNLKAGKPWIGIVKNRCKNGDFYWVEANVSPTYEQGQITGYLSVRSKPSPQQIEEAERLYARIAAGQASLRPRGLFERLAQRFRDGSKQKLMAALLVLPTPVLFLGAFIPHSHTWLPNVIDGALALYLFGMALWLRRGLFRPLQEARQALLRMSEGNFGDQYHIRRNDEIGQLFQGIKIMQNNQRAHIAKERAMFVDSQRYKQSLDNARSNVMIVANDGKISYVNPSFQALLGRHMDALRKALPGLCLNTLEGEPVSCFAHQPLDDDEYLLNLKAPDSCDITIAELTFGLHLTPVFDEAGKRIGTVIEWRERITELAVVDEIKGIVSSVKNGDLSQQIRLDDKDGFFLELCQEINEMVQTIAASFAEIAETMGSVAEGDLTRKINSERAGTYAKIQTSINRTVDYLQRTIDQIGSSSEFFQRASEEILGDNTALSQRTEAQSSTLQNTAAAMNQLTFTVANNAENAQRANELSSSAQEKAQRGGQVVKQAGQAMEEISQSSQKIHEITGVIDEIAFQTNLLALNASVEAARAGDHGKGFAVVATEVRELASRSSRAAMEIKTLISDSGSKVENGAKLVIESHATLNEIVDSVSQVSGLISEIATASAEQATGINEVNDSMLNLDDNTCKNASLAEMVANTSRESYDKANELVELMAFFKTR